MNSIQLIRRTSTRHIEQLFNFLPDHNAKYTDDVLGSLIKKQPDIRQILDSDIIERENSYHRSENEESNQNNSNY